LKEAFFIIAFLCCPFVAAAQRQVLKGKVTSAFQDAGGIYVINRNTEADTATDHQGYFNLPAQSGDTLVFASERFEMFRCVVTEEDMQQSLRVMLRPKAQELKELVITDYSHINEESLGLVPKGQKQYTPAERRLATASYSKMNPMGLDPVINWISGRTAMLKKAFEAEKKENLMRNIEDLYTNEEIIAKFNIPPDYVKGFLFYAAENKYIADALKAGNKERITFLMTGLAQHYLKLLNDEK
jgi:hypothetical protein